jgi:hypothetical protein
MYRLGFEMTCGVAIRLAPPHLAKQDCRQNAASSVSSELYKLCLWIYRPTHSLLITIELQYHNNSNDDLATNSTCLSSRLSQSSERTSLSWAT